MGLLEIFGWSRRKPQPVGHSLESGDRSDEEPDWQMWILRGGLFLGLVVLTVAAFPRGDFYEYTVEVGDTWRQSTLAAPYNFPVYMNAERVEARRDTVRRNTPPYFQDVLNARQRMVRNRDTLRRQLDRILDAYASSRYHRQQGEPEAARRDSVRYLERRRDALLTLSTSQWDYLAKQYVREVQDLSSRGQPAEQGPQLYQRLLDASFDIGAQLLGVGVMDQPRDSVFTDQIIVRNLQEQTQRTVGLDRVYGLNEAFGYAESRLEEIFPENREHRRIATALFRGMFEPSLTYMREATLQERERRARNVTAIQGGVEQGEPIVRKGERVTPEIKRTLTSLERARKDRMGPSLVWKQVGGELLYTLLGFGFFFFYLYLLRPKIWSESRDLLLISVILGFIILLYGIVVRSPWSLYAVPVALASVLLTIVFNSRIALFGTLLLAFTGGQMLGLDLEYTLATFFAGAFGVFSVRDIKNRGQFIVTGALVFVGYLSVLTATWLYFDLPLARVAPDLAFAAFASAIPITSSPFLWALERTFDITTDLTLLELSDTNNKLLKQLSLQAPGSFNHSLQVANLAEAAADRIGAHTLLTRVGALYHDIGKMKKPEYFVENQRTMSNPHDQLKPRMSALIVASHVKEGLEKGREENLPERVLKFIPMHHGTARIEYFYQKALSQAEETGQNVPESEFRYPGPKPDSKETGILMLADSVEAASRSLDDPSPRRLENLIDLIFRERIDDDQLANTDLTFQDLSLIKDTFLKMLLGIYHVRVKYPDQQEEAEEKTFDVVSLAAEQPYDNVSVVYDRDAWGDQMRPEEDARSTKAPRPQLAEASPHSGGGPEGDDGRVEGSDESSEDGVVGQEARSEPLTESGTQEEASSSRE